MKKHQKGYYAYNKKKVNLFEELVLAFITIGILMSVFCFASAWNMNRSLKLPNLNTKVVRADFSTTTPNLSLKTPKKVVVDQKTVIMEYVKQETDKAGLNWDDVKCLIEHESGWNQYGLYDNKNGAGVDRGLFMFSTIWHREVTNECSFDYKCSTQKFIKIAKKDGNFHQWWGYRNNCK